MNADLRPMCLTGTLRQRNTHYYLEEQLSYEADHEAGWTIPRLYRLSETETTVGEVFDYVNRLVIVTGHPRYCTDQHGVGIALDRVVLQQFATQA